MFLLTGFRFTTSYSLSLLSFAVQRRNSHVGDTPPPNNGDAVVTTMQSHAFETFFRQMEPRITTYLLRITGDSDAACDLSQETFLRAWQHFAEVQQHPDPRAWLFRVATNLGLQHVRRRRHVVGSAAPLDQQHDPASSDPGSHWVERALIQQILDELPAKQRALLLLREVYGFSCAETGELLGMTLEAAKMGLYRARLQFRERYLRKGGTIA
jgi:RNA polymerase sigma factor (sigma-70 family)